MSEWMEKVWRHQLKQPDPRSCGAATLVVAGMINDAAYAEMFLTGTHPKTGHQLRGDSIEERFHHEVLSMHKRATGLADVRGHLQVPWPETFGTPPWSVARQMSGGSGVKGTRYDADIVFDRRDALAAILHATRNGHATPFYVGNKWMARHVVLALDPELTTYDPARGRRLTVKAGDFVDAKLDLGGWKKPWFIVVPD